MSESMNNPEPWIKLFASHIERNIIDNETAEYLWSQNFRSVDSLQDLPTENMQELMSSCPGISTLGRQISLKRLREEAIKATGASGHQQHKEQLPPPVEELDEQNLRPCHRLKEESNIVTDSATEKENIVIYQPQRKVIMNDFGVRKYSIGTERIGNIYSEKVILVVGGTGSGKTTLINSMVNYLYDVKSSDPYRFKLISEEDERIEAGGTLQKGKSRTKKVSAYVLNDTKKEYRFTIVDTPGFGDPDGIDQDNKTIEYIKQWFERGGEDGMAIINAVCIVVQATQTRLTANVVYELNSVIALFGTDMVDNIVIMYTFCDGMPPLASECLEAAKIPTHTSFKFNNSAIFRGSLINKNVHGNADKDKLASQRFFWKMGMKSYDEFFDRGLERLPGISLTMSCDVLRNREKLTEHASALNAQMKKGFEKVHEISEQIDIAQRSHAQLQQKEAALGKEQKIAKQKTLELANLQKLAQEKSDKLTRKETELNNQQLVAQETAKKLAQQQKIAQNWSDKLVKQEGELVKQQLLVAQKKHEMSEKEDLVKRYQNAIDNNKNFETERDDVIHKEIDLRGQGVFTTYCLKCNNCCHEKCKIADTGAKEWCSIMNQVIPASEDQIFISTEDTGFDFASRSGRHYFVTEEQKVAQKLHATCKICNCHWKEHSNVDFYISKTPTKVKYTNADTEKEFNLAKGEKNKSSKMLEQIRVQLIEQENKMADIRQLTAVARIEKEKSYKDLSKISADCVEQEKVVAEKARATQDATLEKELSEKRLANINAECEEQKKMVARSLQATEAATIEKKQTHRQLEKMALEFVEQEKLLAGIVGEVREVINKLNETALLPQFMTDVKYLEMLIAAEKQTCSEGYMVRLKGLNRLLETAKLIERAKTTGINLQETTEYNSFEYLRITFPHIFNKNGSIADSEQKATLGMKVKAFLALGQ